MDEDQRIGWYNQETGEWDKEQPTMSETIEEKIKRRHYRTYTVTEPLDGLADPEWEEDEKAYVEERYQRYLNRIENLITQDEFWVNREGERILLKDMSCRYKANVHNFLLKRAAHIEFKYAFSFATGPQPSGDAACDAFDYAMQQHMDHVVEVGAEQWLREMPLLRALLYQSRASEFDGPID
jgi:hypothetical protein